MCNYRVITWGCDCRKEFLCQACQAGARCEKATRELVEMEDTCHACDPGLNIRLAQQEYEQVGARIMDQIIAAKKSGDAARLEKLQQENKRLWLHHWDRISAAARNRVVREVMYPEAPGPDCPNFWS